MAQGDDGLSPARACIYLLDRTFRRGMLVPVWSCPPEYRQRFLVSPASFVLDATELDGKPVSWDDFGGLEKYLKLLDFCAAAVEGRERSPDSLPDSEEEAFSGHSNGAGTVEAGEPPPPVSSGQTPAARRQRPDARSPATGHGTPEGMVRGFIDDRCVVGAGDADHRQGTVRRFPGLVHGNRAGAVVAAGLRDAAHGHGVQAQAQGEGTPLVGGAWG